MPEQNPATTLHCAVGDLIDALSDELKHEINYSTHVQEHIRTVVLELDDERYLGYLDSWWLGGGSRSEGGAR